MTPEERFWSYVDRSGEGCHPWTRSTRGGYGQYSYRDRNYYTHRLAWLLTFGPIPEGYRVRQDCRNKLCCNPDHLLLITSAQQARYTVADGSNREANKTHCPRGHLLQKPNLVVYESRRGRRSCLACSRTKDVSVFPERKLDADARYELIMRGWC
jgi:hypothetical protein